MLWVVDTMRSAGRHTIPVCVETDVRLYVLFVGPAAPGEGGPMSVRPAVRVTTPDGASLAWRGTGSRGDRVADFLVAQFDPPSPDAKYLDVCLAWTPMDTPDAEAVADIEARLRRLEVAS
jgi:hypothetical protein